MKLDSLLALLGVVATAVGFANPGAAQIEPQADRILREMSQYLATAEEFTFEADITYDAILATGEKIEVGGVARAAVRRPNGLHVVYLGDDQRRRIVYDGSTFTLNDLDKRLYAVAEVPATLDAAMDRVFDQFGVTVPIADLVYSDPYATLTGSVETGSWVGLHPVDGVPCHHLTFSQEGFDWQIWIAAGPQPVPRKLLMEYWSEEGSPRYNARISGWNFEPRLSAGYFEFHPPAGTGLIEFLPAEQTETQP